MSRGPEERRGARLKPRPSATPSNPSSSSTPSPSSDDVWRALAEIPDPEIPVISIVDLGVVKDVRVEGARVHVDFTPTFIGCPALETMRLWMEQAIRGLGAEPDVEVVLDDSWSTGSDQPCRTREAPVGRLRASRAAERGRADPAAARARPVPLPVVRLDGHAARQRVRPDAVPLAALLQRLPPAVRAVQDDLSASTHTANQPPPLAGYDLFSENRPLVEALLREGDGAATERCAAFGLRCGEEPLELGRLANEHPPTLHTHDRFGERIDEVEFHPAWHALLALGLEHGVHSLPWREPGPGAHVTRAALFMTLAYAEAGVGCPLSMTYAAVPALRAGAPALAARVGAAAVLDHVRPRAAAARRQARSPLRDGDDGATGRLGRPLERDARGAQPATTTCSRATSGSARRR